MQVLNINRDDIPQNVVYICRPYKWGNPFIIGKDGDRQQVIQKYKNYILNNKNLMAALHELIGKDLACYCKPLACHGDVLVELVKQITYEKLDSEYGIDR